MKEISRKESILLFICVLLSLALFYVLMLNLWGLSLFGETIDYTRFGTWSNALSGIGTTSALIVALTSLYLQRSIYRKAEARRFIDEETSIFLWLTFKEVRDDSGKLVCRLWDMIVQNSTVAPIYHWQISIDSYTTHICSFLKHPLLPGVNVFNLSFLDNLEPSKVPESILVFEGRSGRIWTRSTRGTIKEDTIKDLNCNHNVIEG
ncbi:MAG: hypothetical protein NTX65_04915 [Ignavibacteriales bacterium]|nr:hypothetical protein [Ignavibacteriales bacterium]